MFDKKLYFNFFIEPNFNAEALENNATKLQVVLLVQPFEQNKLQSVKENDEQGVMRGVGAKYFKRTPPLANLTLRPWRLKTNDVITESTKNEKEVNMVVQIVKIRKKTISSSFSCISSIICILSC